MRYLEPQTVRRVQRLALANGGSLRQFADGSQSRTVLWNVAGDCLSPVTVELHGRASDRQNKRVVVSETENRPNFAELEVPCRKCDNCLRRRAGMWRYRAMDEYRQSSRTWLATLTLGPTAHVQLLSRARVRLKREGADYDGLPGAEQFLQLELEGFKELQKWFKRLRKNHPDSPFRYLAVAESHKSGVPHWHVLIHEAGKPLTYDGCLKGSWNLGFDSYKLVRDARAAGYVTKYLSKAIEARVRASSRYGRSGWERMPPLAEVQCSERAVSAERMEREKASPEREEGMT